MMHVRTHEGGRNGSVWINRVRFRSNCICKGGKTNKDLKTEKNFGRELQRRVEDRSWQDQQSLHPIVGRRYLRI